MITRKKSILLLLFNYEEFWSYIKLDTITPILKSTHHLAPQIINLWSVFPCLPTNSLSIISHTILKQISDKRSHIT